jgi:hypothetical protein
MSDSIAIAAVTNALRQLIQSGIDAEVPGTVVTTRPLDTARAETNGSQLNLFLYNTLPNAAWRNRDIPWNTRSGELSHPPLAMHLYYLITAFYGQNEDSVDTTTDTSHIFGTHRILGAAMSVLHDCSMLAADDINSLLPAEEQQNHPYDQLEKIRITPEPLSLDEVSKLWSGFQTQYRLSAAYEVSALLIESRQNRTHPLPVLRRGEQDQGSHVVAAQLPNIVSVRPPRFKPSAEPGDILTVEGDYLDTPDLTARLSHHLLATPLTLIPLSGRTSKSLELQLPDEVAVSEFPGTWVAGVYSLDLVVQRPGLPVWTTNTVPFALAPRIKSITPMSASAGTVNLILTCIPQLRSEQRIALLFGDREIQPTSMDTPGDPTAETTLNFDFDVGISENPPDVYVVRLRVDGVDSIPVIFSDTAPPEFDPNQKVTITP